MNERTAPNINILSFQSQEQNSFGNFLNWSLRYGRIIVIVTEFLVIAAFISRFYFDRQLSDLNDNIELKTAIVEGSQGTEKEFLLLQKTLQNIAVTYDNQKDFSKLLASLNEVKPADLLIRELNVRDKELSFTGSVPSPNSLNTFLSNLSQSKKFSDISLDDLSIKDGQLFLSARAVVNPEAYE